MLCPSCSAEADEKAVFCPQCGARLLNGDERNEAAAADAGAPPEGDKSRAGDARERFRRAVTSRQGDDVADEEQIWDGHYSRLAMVGWWVAAAVLTVAALIVGAMFLSDGGQWWLLLGLVLLGWIVVGGFYAYRRYSLHYYLTDQRFLHEAGILWRRTDRIELIDIDDVTVQQGPIERMFGVGTIHISSSDKTDPEIALPGIEEVKEVAGMIDDLRRRERRRRGLHIEAV